VLKVLKVPKGLTVRVQTVLRVLRVPGVQRTIRIFSPSGTRTISPFGTFSTLSTVSAASPA
jgi:hypothetical protein